MIFVFVLTISPYLIRNYISFERIILHSGFGYNVWKAYNPKADVEGFYVEEEELKLKINKVEKIFCIGLMKIKFILMRLRNI